MRIATTPSTCRIVSSLFNLVSRLDLLGFYCQVSIILFRMASIILQIVSGFISSRASKLRSLTIKYSNGTAYNFLVELAESRRFDIEPECGRAFS